MRVLMQGDKGTDVERLQYWLMGAGYYPKGMIPNGDYDEKTVLAVSRLRKDLGLQTRDGRFCPLVKEGLKPGFRYIPPIDFDEVIPS